MSDIQKELINLVRKQAHIQQQWDKIGQRRLLKFIVTVIPKLLGVESCSVFIQDPIRQKVWLAAATDLTEGDIEVPKQGSLVGEVIATGQYQIRTHMDKQIGVHTAIDSNTGFVTRDILCVPIKGLLTNETTGAIQILNKRDGASYSDEDRQLLEEMAYHVQLLVENVFFGQEIAVLSDKVRRRMAFIDWVLRSWAILMVMLVLAVIIYVTPVVLRGF